MVEEKKESVAKKFARFKDSEWFGVKHKAVIGGVGGIGSWFSLLFMRTGDHTCVVYDMDTIEDTNMAGQLYSDQDIGKKKVDAMQEHVKQFAGADVKFHAINDKITAENCHRAPLMISCFDNMEARKVFFEHWKADFAEFPDKDPSEYLFVDGRMNAENFQLFFVTPENAKHYEENFLYGDGDVPDLACSFKATSHTAAMLSAKMVTGITNWTGNNKTGVDSRVVPYFYQYDLAFMMERVYEYPRDII